MLSAFGEEMRCKGRNKEGHGGSLQLIDRRIWDLLEFGVRAHPLYFRFAAAYLELEKNSSHDIGGISKLTVFISVVSVFSCIKW